MAFDRDYPGGTSREGIVRDYWKRYSPGPSPRFKPEPPDIVHMETEIRGLKRELHDLREVVRAMSEQMDAMRKRLT